MAQSPSVSYSAGKLPARLSPSPNMNAQALTPASLFTCATTALASSLLIGIERDLQRVSRWLIERLSVAQAGGSSTAAIGVGTSVGSGVATGFVTAVPARLKRFASSSAFAENGVAKFAPRSCSSWSSRMRREVDGQVLQDFVQRQHDIPRFAGLDEAAIFRRQTRRENRRRDGDSSRRQLRFDKRKREVDFRVGWNAARYRRLVELAPAPAKSVSAEE